MKEGYNAIIAVTDYEIKEENISIDIYAQFVKSEEEQSQGKIIKNMLPHMN